ncbi:MAG: S8 family peptidase, partial [Sphingomonadales bacterium]
RVACLTCALATFRPAFAQDHAPAAADQQILVMLKLPPPHFRPNSSYSGPYGDALSSSARQREALGIARKQGLQVVESWPMPLIGVDCYVMHVPNGVSVDAASKLVARNKSVVWSEPMRVYRGLGGSQRSNDPLFRVEPAATAWRLADLHRVATGRGVRVAIVDSRVETNHPDLTGQFVAEKDFVDGRAGPPEQHGTEVAGVIGAKEGNGIGIAGIAPGARLMALRACWQTAVGPTLCDTLSLARALQYAIENRAQVINLSLSGPPAVLLTKLVAIALARNTTIVAAFDPALPGGGFPASYRGVIAVADESLQPLPSGLYGAPGRDVPTTQPGGKWYLVNGSSFAAAHVSGLVALVRERVDTARLPKISIARFANGAIDACGTLVRTSRTCSCSCALPGQITSTSR